MSRKVLFRRLAFRPFRSDDESLYTITCLPEFSETAETSDHRHQLHQPHLLSNVLRRPYLSKHSTHYLVSYGILASLFSMASSASFAYPLDAKMIEDSRTESDGSCFQHPLV